MKMTGTDLVNLIGHCGLYCNACSIRQGKIKAAVNNLRDIIAAYGIDKSMPDLANWDPGFKHYDGFKQVMEGLVKIFGDCPGCLGGGGDPNCKVRSCAKQRGYRTCIECAEAKTCQKLDPYRKYFEPALQRIKEKGIKSYADEMQRKVDQGYSYPTEVNTTP
jgi:hypothetical protein